jgi:hypothetical protein
MVIVSLLRVCYDVFSEDIVLIGFCSIVICVVCFMCLRGRLVFSIRVIVLVVVFIVVL